VIDGDMHGRRGGGDEGSGVEWMTMPRPKEPHLPDVAPPNVSSHTLSPLPNKTTHTTIMSETTTTTVPAKEVIYCGGKMLIWVVVEHVD
jgi:hypothetical protein